MLNLGTLNQKSIMDIKDIQIILNCELINIQSVCNKTMNIRELINDNKFDILAVSETWLSNVDLSVITEMMPPTHTFLHTPREGEMRGGWSWFICFKGI